MCSVTVVFGHQTHTSKRIKLPQTKLKERNSQSQAQLPSTVAIKWCKMCKMCTNACERWIDDDARAPHFIWFHFGLLFRLRFFFCCHFCFMAFHLAMGYTHSLQASMRTIHFVNRIVFSFVSFACNRDCCLDREFRNRVHIDINWLSCGRFGVFI